MCSFKAPSPWTLLSQLLDRCYNHWALYRRQTALPLVAFPRTEKELENHLHKNTLVPQHRRMLLSANPGFKEMPNSGHLWERWDLRHISKYLLMGTFGFLPVTLSPFFAKGHRCLLVFTYSTPKIARFTNPARPMPICVSGSECPCFQFPLYWTAKVI